MLRLHYTLLRPDLDSYHTIECDNYKFEMHPVTGKYSLQTYTVVGAESKLSEAVSGVVHFYVKRP